MCALDLLFYDPPFWSRCPSQGYKESQMKQVAIGSVNQPKFAFRVLCPNPVTQGPLSHYWPPNSLSEGSPLRILRRTAYKILKQSFPAFSWIVLPFPCPRPFFGISNLTLLSLAKCRNQFDNLTCQYDDLGQWSDELLLSCQRFLFQSKSPGWTTSCPQREHQCMRDLTARCPPQSYSKWIACVEYLLLSAGWSRWAFVIASCPDVP